MKRTFLSILAIFLTSRACLALEIVYPKKNPVVINSASTFFIGSTAEDEKLKINDIEVEVSPQGAFAQSVPLAVGKNSFKIKSISKDGVETVLDFTIEKPAAAKTTYSPPVLIEYPPMGNFFVKKEGAPLRATAVDGGINRLAHLPDGTQLTINGEKNGFYRVYLNSKTTGWIDKSSVEQDEEKQACTGPVNLHKAKCRLTKDFYIYEFDFDKKVPFAVKEETTGLSVEFFYAKGSPDDTFNMSIPSQRLTGYDGYWDGEKFILKVRRTPIDCKNPLNDVTIVVDAGHGGAEAGAIGCCGDREKDINLAISKNLQVELEKRGAKALMTRKEDIDVSLSDRVKFAREKEAAILVSIHANALPDSADPIKNRGTSVYYYHNQAKGLAESILNSMTTQLGTQNDKVRQGSLALVRPSASVSVLIEVAYIINPDDYALLTDKAFQEKCAKSIADGIEEYLRK